MKTAATTGETELDAATGEDDTFRLVREPKKRTKKKPPISKDDARLLADFADFRHIDFVSAQVRCNQTVDGMYSWLRRKVNAGLAKNHKLTLGNRKFWTLTRDAVQRLNAEHNLGISNSASHVPTTKLAELNGFLSYCSRPGHPLLRRCRPCLMPAAFPDVHDSFVKSGERHDPLRKYLLYIDELRDIVGLFHLDGGADNQFDEYICPKFFSLYTGYPSISRRVREDKFELTVVTTTKFGHERLSEELDKPGNRPPCPHNIVLLEHLEAIQIWANKELEEKRSNRRKKK